MAHSQATKDELRKKYIFDGLSLTMAAVTTDVGYATAQRWKNQAADAGDDWDKVKVAHTMAGGDLEDISRQILTDFIIQFKATMESIKATDDIGPGQRVEMLTSLADAYNKTVASSRKLLPETSKLAIALQVLELLAKYIQEHKPDLLIEFMSVLDPFGDLISKELK
ncbi:DUF1804 family protein [uncultured Psychrobacter sp.]|uniref:DUF1804 family protein n=1 Tax=uncultured Psychrobacter sp. TaxID=259303 RepID=UPI000E9C9435|nr:DNA-binding protein [Psychrobacter sp.]|tara:strand:+ start:12278 stop:12778 length:501 start_codon:yes stop_codon:yes gene_type:complete